MKVESEPVVETRRGDAVLVAGGERSIVQLRAEVAGVDIRDHLTCVLLCAQESADEIVETNPFSTQTLLQERAARGERRPQRIRLGAAAGHPRLD